MTKRSAKVVQLVPADGARPTLAHSMALFNATRHGVMSRHTVMPWEDRDEYQELVDALVIEYAPAGPTERHLVEEVASVMWRRRRLELAEGAAYAIGIRKAVSPHAETAKTAVAHLGITIRNEDVSFETALTATDEETAKELRAERAASEKAFKAFKHLGGYAGLRAESEEAYREALAMLAPGTRDWWLDEEPTETAEALHEWLRGAVTTLQRQVTEIEHRGAIRDHTMGVAFDPDKLERLARYETHLDRKMERTVGMLIKLRELRAQRNPPTA